MTQLLNAIFCRVCISHGWYLRNKIFITSHTLNCELDSTQHDSPDFVTSYLLYFLNSKVLTLIILVNLRNNFPKWQRLNNFTFIQNLNFSQNWIIHHKKKIIENINIYFIGFSFNYNWLNFYAKNTVQFCRMEKRINKTIFWLIKSQ